jgi:hypothetical protein
MFTLFQVSSARLRSYDDICLSPLTPLATMASSDPASTGTPGPPLQ